jgi:hypothetical protein
MFSKHVLLLRQSFCFLFYPATCSRVQ